MWVGSHVPRLAGERQKGLALEDRQECLGWSCRNGLPNERNFVRLLEDDVKT